MGTCFFFINFVQRYLTNLSHKGWVCNLNSLKWSSFHNYVILVEWYNCLNLIIGGSWSGLGWMVVKHQRVVTVNKHGDNISSRVCTLGWKRTQYIWHNWRAKHVFDEARTRALVFFFSGPSRGRSEGPATTKRPHAPIPGTGLFIYLLSL